MKLIRVLLEVDVLTTNFTIFGVFLKRKKEHKDDFVILRFLVVIIHTHHVSITSFQGHCKIHTSTHCFVSLISFMIINYDWNCYLKSDMF